MVSGSNPLGNVMSRYNRYKTIRLSLLENYKPFSWRKNKMSNTRNISIGLAFTGFAAQVFVLISGDALATNYANIFNAVGSLSLFSAFAWYVLSQPSDDKKNSDREGFYRDIEAIYRYVDDTARDLREEIRDTERDIANCANNKYSRK